MKIFKLTKKGQNGEAVKWFDNTKKMLKELESLIEWCENEKFEIEMTRKEKKDE